MKKTDFKINDINFYLKNPNAKNKTSIILSVYLSNERLKLSSGISIDPKKWDKSKQRIKGHLNQFDLNQRLETLKSQVLNIIIHLTNNNKTINRDIVKNMLKDNYSEIINSNNSFFDHFDDFINTYRYNGIRPTKKRITRYIVVKKRLMEFKEKHNFDVSFANINTDFYNAFVEFIQKKGLVDNTISTFIKIIKTFMNWALEKELHNNLRFKKFKFSETDSDIIVFTMDEIKKLENYDFSDNPMLNKSRDHLLMGVFTGLRYNDLKRLNKTNINFNEGTIKILTHKTNENVVIPITGKLNKILKKYPDFDFKFLNINKQNNLIKEVCRLAGIDTEIVRTRRKENQYIEETFKKYELVTTHIGQRTFITQSLSHNVNPEIVKKVSGHRDHRSFSKYIKFAEDQVKEGYKGVFE